MPGDVVPDDAKLHWVWVVKVEHPMMIGGRPGRNFEQLAQLASEEDVLLLAKRIRRMRWKRVIARAIGR